MTIPLNEDMLAAFAAQGEPRHAVRDDRSHLPGGPAASLLDGATWIAFPEREPFPAGQRPAYAFRTTVTLDSDPTTATLAVTAHGVYEAFINGTRVGDQEQTPGFTAYHSTLYVQSYNVADLLHQGDNELRLVVSDGWFRGLHGFTRVGDGFGSRTAVIARLDVDGQVTTTDTSWECAESEHVRADQMDGQVTDLRRIGQETWVAAVPSDDLLTTDWSRLDRSPAPPVRAVQEYPAVSVTRLDSGRQIVDFGVNLNGTVRLTNLGPAGTTTTLTHGEHLDPAGDLTMAHLAAFNFRTQEKLPTGQIDVVSSRGQAGDVFQPSHSTKGFRYVAVDGRDDDLQTGDLTALLLRSDLQQTGWFSCSDPDLNALHEIAVQSWRANTLDVPTDCPTRERAGFTGDYQIFIRTAAYLDDVRTFSDKWLRAVAEEQHDTGCIPNVAPTAGVAKDRPIAMEGSAGWGDATTIVPWELYQAYGDVGVLRRNLPMMRKWVDYAADLAARFRHVDRGEGEPAAHERYLWDCGFHWGEWLEPGGEGFNPTKDAGITATAYLSHSASLVAAAAEVLGEAEIATTYRTLADNAADAWRTEYWRDGRLRIETQATYTRGLAFGLFLAEQVSAAAARLAELVAEAGDHVGTGFLSTPMLLPMLADHGYADRAYRVLQNETTPGWYVMLRRGATTIWEEWEGVDDDGNAKASLNHYSKGAVITFLHEYLCGLQNLAPGWHKFRVRPLIGGGVTWASTAHESPYGRIEAGWTVEAGQGLVVRITVPTGTTAVVELPGREPIDLGAGDHELR